MGDAAGLVNPLQGEGIAQAMSSGRAAAEAILAARAPRPPAIGGTWSGTTSPISASPLPDMPPWWADRVAVSAVGRLLTTPVVGRALAGGWGIFWNELLDGAAPGAARRVAAVSTQVGRAVTAGTGVSRWFRANIDRV